GRPRRAPAVAGQPIEIVIGTAIGGGNLYHARLMVAIERELSRHSCDCLIRTCGSDYDQFLLLCDALRRTKPKDLLIIGVGYKAQISGSKLVLNLGFSHTIEYTVPQGIKVTVAENTKIAIEGCDSSSSSPKGRNPRAAA
ncbi:MAG: 50S ribosomal protein L6, partial [candidate division NC10 bacterium]